MTYVAFLRAINVGGHIVKMDRLRALFEEIGFKNVKTFIASGNVIFDSASKNAAALEKKIAAHLEKSLGYEVATFVRSADEVKAIAAREMYKPAEITGTLYIVLLGERCDAQATRTLAGMQSAVDELRVNDREIYWNAKNNFANAVFQPAKMEKALGRPATFRNVTTLRKLAALLK